MKKRNIENIINNIHDYNPTEEELKIIGDLAGEYQDKSDEDIFVEIIRVNDQLEQQMSKEEYESIFEKLEALRPMLSAEQNEKIDKVLKIISRDK